MNLQAQPFCAFFGASSARRRLAVALVLSALAHLLLLWPAPVADVRPRLSATLRSSPPAEREEAVAQAVPAVIAVPSSVPVPRAPPRPAQSVAAARTPHAERASATPVATVATAMPAVDETIDADGLRSYRIALALAARRFRDYPAQSIERGESGTVALRVALLGGAGAGRVELLRTSGYAALDGEAQAMLTKAVHATLLPETLRGRAFSFEMPVEFMLPPR
ncbi:MAG TPA: TonB family protein [Rhodocyclaceae bacterium]|nr:TonB family protein [Rhodocyclaceae bacterium]